MKRILSLVLSLTMMLSFVGQDLVICQENEDFYKGKLKGEEAAEMYSKSDGSVAGGAVVGFLFGLIGTLIGTAVSSGAQPKVPEQYAPKDVSASYRAGFNEGYSKKAKRKKTMSFFWGGIGGSLLAGLVVGSASK